MQKSKSQDNIVRPIFKRYGFFAHLTLFVLFAIFVPADWYIRVMGLLLHFILPYVWHGMLGAETAYDTKDAYPAYRFWGDVHIGVYAALMSMLWGNVIISAVNATVFWNSSLIMLTLFWGMIVAGHQYITGLIAQRNATQEHIAILEDELRTTREVIYEADEIAKQATRNVADIPEDYHIYDADVAPVQMTQQK